MNLDGKVVVVTGASQGIGRQIALDCAAAGADLVLAARSADALDDTAEQVRGLGRSAQAIPTDVTDPDSVDAMARAVLDRWGRVDVLVNNSGIAGPSAPLWEIDPADWHETMAVNVTGVFSCCAALMPPMIERGAGSVVIIGSITGKRALLNRSAYATSKAALIGLTRTLAEDAGPHGVRVNLVSPGAVEGPRIDRVFEMQAEAQGRTPEQVREQFLALSPLRQLVTASDIARMVVFLASDDAARITGADMNVTAGVVMH